MSKSPSDCDFFCWCGCHSVSRLLGLMQRLGENRCRGLMEDDSSIVIEDACGEDGMRNLQSFTKYQAFRVT